MKWLFFGLGILLGTMLGVVIMCIVQVNRTHRLETVDER